MSNRNNNNNTHRYDEDDDDDDENLLDEDNDNDLDIYDYVDEYLYNHSDNDDRSHDQDDEDEEDEEELGNHDYDDDDEDVDISLDTLLGRLPNGNILSNLINYLQQQRLHHQLQQQQQSIPTQTPTIIRQPSLKNERIGQVFRMRSYGGSSQVSPSSYLLKRELYGLEHNRQIQFTHNLLPQQTKSTRVKSLDSKIFCCKLSSDGNRFMTASQDRKIRFFNTKSWTEDSVLTARDINWSIIDTDFSQDQKHIIYSSWSPYIHISNTNCDDSTHYSLDLRPSIDSFCIFSLRFSPSGSEILGGSSRGNIYLYDLNSNQRTMEVHGHIDDINSVTYLDYSGNLFATGSDDYYIKVWDKRILRGENSSLSTSTTNTTTTSSTTRTRLAKPVGVLTGHSRGLTHVATKEDGIYLLSNSKDNTAKLWDIRKLSTKLNNNNGNGNQSNQNNDFSSYHSEHLNGLDYRFPNYLMGANVPITNEPDLSVQTYRGHKVFQTLIRCYFSPTDLTAQKYIYSGSSDGCVYIYDVLTGKLIKRLNQGSGGGGAPIRDLSWSPLDPLLIAVGWDGHITTWSDWDIQDYDYSSDDDDDDHNTSDHNGSSSGSDDDQDI